MKQVKTALSWLFVSVLIIGLDQGVKYWVLHRVTDQSVIPVFPFLNIIFRLNAGAAFGFLDNQSGWQIYLLSGISAIVSVVLIIWLGRLKRSAWCTAFPVSLVLGGALGNLMDRVHYGYVIDFIDFHVKNWHFATLNIADSAVCVGAVWLIVNLICESICGRNSN